MGSVTIVRDQPTVIVLSKNVVASIQNNQNTKIGGQGIQGPPGIGAGSDIAPVAFSYGDASGTIFTPTQSGTLTLIRLEMVTAFNGTNPSLKVGTISSPEAILAAAQNDPSVAIEYENTPALHLAANQAVVLTITPGAGASQGSGIIYLTFVLD